MSQIRRQWFTWQRLWALMLGASLALPAPGAQIDVCTQAELFDAIANASDGEIITLACDGTLTITNSIEITNPDPDTPIALTIDATGHSVTISSLTDSNSVGALRLFSVGAGVDLTLINLTLANGRSTNGGAIYNLG